MTLLFSLPGGTEWMLILIVFGLILITKIFYLITLQKTLEAVSVENRKMTPANVWLLLIPLFNLVWHFIVVSNVADSLRAEADSKNTQIYEPRPAYSIGLTMCILNCLFFLPGINTITSLASLVCWIVYWIKVAGYRTQLINSDEFKIETV